MEKAFSSSESIGKLALALSKAQAQMSGALKDSENPYFKSRYADLESVWAACRKPLATNELAIIQLTEAAEVGVNIVTVLSHSSSEWISSTLNMRPQKNDPQGFGSAISYGRRYALAAMVGVYQVDDDAEKATQRGNENRPPAKITPDQAKDLAKLLADSGRDTDKFLDWLRIDELENLPASEFERAKKALNAAIKKKNEEKEGEAA